METPRFEYSRSALKQRAQLLAGLKAPFGMTVNYAVKANPHPEILQLFENHGLSFDASSSYEAQQVLDAGINGKKITLSSQQKPHNLAELLKEGVHFVATSQSQLEVFFDTPNRPNEVGLRVNPGVGSGINNRLTTGGLNASFGVWHEYIPDMKALCDEKGVKITHLTEHIGTGTDPKVWAEMAHSALDIVKTLPDVRTLSLGGGFKTGYQPGEEDVDIESIIDAIGDALSDFEVDTGRKIHLEIEPGRFAVVHAGTLVATIDDIVDTGKDGHTFLRLNTGMNDILRPTMYGAYHKIEVINDSVETMDYVVVGHNCETGDTLTVGVADPETIAPRTLNKASIGDEIRIYDAGAYCASMRARGYNAFPDAKEYLVD